MENKKVCTKCKLSKNKSEFHKHKLGKDGLRPKCKKCRRLENKEYHLTKRGTITKMMSSMNNSSKRRNMPPPDFNKEELSVWVLSQDIFHTLYKDYIDCNYDPMLKPSIDRVNDFISYTFSNMRIITWKENYNKSRTDMVNGNNTKNSRAVIQTTLEGVFVKEHFSMADAGKNIDTNWQNISACCRGIHKTCKGFRFHYKHKESVKHKHNL